MRWRSRPRPAGPVFGMVTRLVPEKGFDLLMPLLDRLLSDDVRLIILGEGDPGYETALAIAARKYPAKFAYRRTYDEALAHLIEAGADITLIPSRIEPSGLSAMYSLKYGALPVARATGGIQEIIEDYDPTLDSGLRISLLREHAGRLLGFNQTRPRNFPGQGTLGDAGGTRDVARLFLEGSSGALRERLCGINGREQRRGVSRRGNSRDLSENTL